MIHFNIPAGCRVFLARVEYGVEAVTVVESWTAPPVFWERDAEIDAPPGDYVLRVRSYHLLNFETEVEVGPNQSCNVYVPEVVDQNIKSRWPENRVVFILPAGGFRSFEHSTTHMVMR